MQTELFQDSKILLLTLYFVGLTQGEGMKLDPVDTMLAEVTEASGGHSSLWSSERQVTQTTNPTKQLLNGKL